MPNKTNYPIPATKDDYDRVGKEAETNGLTRSECLHGLLDKAFSNATPPFDSQKGLTKDSIIKLIYPCVLCKEKFETEPEYAKHMKERHKDKATVIMLCQYCAEPFFNLDTLLTHKQQLHNERKTLEYTSPDGPLEYTSPDGLDHRYDAPKPITTPEDNPQDMEQDDSKPTPSHGAIVCEFCEMVFGSQLQKDVHQGKVKDSGYSIVMCEKMPASTDSDEKPKVVSKY